MTPNGYIYTRLQALLEVLDARAYVCIFLNTENPQINPGTLIREGILYNILADQEFMDTYAAYTISGISITLGKVNIQIEWDRVDPYYESASVVQNVEV